MSVCAIITLTFQGRNGAGTISVPGVKVGDVMVMAAVSGTTPLTNEFWPLISTDDEVHQASAGDETGNTYTAVFVRQA